MKHISQFVVAALAVTTLSFAGCDSKAKDKSAEEAEEVAEQLEYETYSYDESEEIGETKVSNSIEMDYPTSFESEQAKGIRRWMLKTLRCYSSAGEFVDVSDVDTDDGQALLDAYGKKGFKMMKKSSESLLEEDVDWGFMASQTNNVAIKVQVQEDNYLTYCITQDTYTGGAHGMNNLTYITFDNKGKEIGWGLVDTLACRKTLNKLLKKGLADYMGISEGELSEYDIWGMENGVLPLPGTPPAITDKGIVFVYQLYEILAYVYNTPTITVPFDEIEPCLKPKAKKLLDIED